MTKDKIKKSAEEVRRLAGHLVDIGRPAYVEDLEVFLSLAERALKVIEMKSRDVKCEYCDDDPTGELFDSTFNEGYNQCLKEVKSILEGEVKP